MSGKVRLMVNVRFVHHYYGEKPACLCITILANMGRRSVWVCGVSVGCVLVCYSTHHRVMSQARDDFEGFLKAHMTKEEKEEKVIVHVETSLSV